MYASRIHVKNEDPPKIYTEHTGDMIELHPIYNDWKLSHQLSTIL